MSGLRGGFEVAYTAAARADLTRFVDFLLNRAETLEDVAAASALVDALDTYIAQRLSHNPFICRKAGRDPFRRELVIPFPGDGYVALFAIEAEPGETKRGVVTILALRHQREEDYFA